MSVNAWLRKPQQLFFTNTMFNSKMILDSIGVRKLGELMVDPTFISSMTIGDAKDWLSSLVLYPFKLVGNEDAYISGGQILSNKLQIEDYVTDIQTINLNESGYYNLGETYYSRHYNNFMDFYPYTRVELFLPFLGKVELNPNDLVNKYIQIRLQVDFNSGQGIYIVGVNDESIPFINDPSGNPTPYIIDYEKEKTIRIIGTYTFQLGISIPLGSSNQADNIRNLVSIGVRTLGNISASGVSYSLGAMSGAKALTTGIFSVFNGVSESLNYFTAKGEVDRPNSSSILMCGTNAARLVIYRPNIINLSDNYAHLHGYPLGEVKKLSSLSGYTKISAVHTENIPALNDELVAIENALYSGVIL